MPDGCNCGYQDKISNGVMVTVKPRRPVNIITHSVITVLF